MAAIITNYYRLFNARQFVESFAEPYASSDANANTYHYVFIGRPQVWDNENLPPTPVDTMKLQSDVYKDMIAMKRLYNTDVSHVVPREDWVSSTVYDEYDHDRTATNPASSGATSLYLSNFYVMTDEYKVYKCLFNNNGAASTVKPTSTGTTSVTLADGYIWKYMYTIDTDSILKFLTPEFMPVLVNTTVRDAAVEGAIDVIKIVSGGAGYVSTPNVQIYGDGNSTATVAVAALNGGNVANITMTSVGNGYHVANVVIAGGNPAANATARAILSPPGGHGSDAVNELGGYYVMMTSRLTYNEGAGDYPTVNDFRRIGIVTDPKNFGTQTRATANTLAANYTLSTNTTSAAFTIDEIVTGSTSGAKARILSTTDPVVGGLANTRITQPLEDTITNHVAFVVGETITGNVSGSTGNITQILNPEVQPHSGTVIYVDNRRNISRQADQAESIHIVIEF